MPKKTFDQVSSKKKKAIFSACIKLLAMNGYSNTSIKLLASRLHISDGHLYYYFTGKEDLITWVIDTAKDIWMEHHRRHVLTKSPIDVFELFKFSLLQMIRFVREHHDIYGAYFQLVNEPHFPLAEHMASQVRWIDDVYVQAVQAEMNRNTVRSDTSPQLIAMVMDVVNTRLQEFCYNTSLDHIGVSTMDDEQLNAMVDNLISLFRDGIGVKKSAESLAM